MVLDPVENYKKDLDELSDITTELNWWKEYAKNLEIAIQEIRELIDESTGVYGYHLNGRLSPWKELLENSMFDIIEDDIIAANKKDRKYIFNDTKYEERDILYIKQFDNLPSTIQYTPVYGGTKFIKTND